MEGYGNSFENQEYLADDHTLYGAWRFLLREPLEDGEQVELELARYGEAEPGEPAPLLWEKALTFSVDPIQGEQFELDAVLSAQVRGKPVPVSYTHLCGADRGGEERDFPPGQRPEKIQDRIGELSEWN